LGEFHPHLKVSESKSDASGLLYQAKIQ
jgi:hypothetical protein